MKFFKEYKHEIVFFLILALALVVAGILIVISKNNIDGLEDDTIPAVDIDLSDVDNVAAVESRLDYKMKISQGYLLTYTTNKSGIWYMSSAKVKNIKIKDSDAYITLSDNNKTLKAWIEADKVNIKKDDIINFVGTVELSDGSLKLSKISVDSINYKNVTEIIFSDLVDNINLVLDNKFVIDGYMITDGSKYKLCYRINAYC